MGIFSRKKIKTVKVLGIRTAEQTKLLATHNIALYSLIVVYTDDSRELVECDGNELEKKYLEYIAVE